MTDVRLPPPCTSGQVRPHDAEPDSPTARALRHYDRAITALVGTTYGGLSAPERTRLLVSLCRARRRLADGDPPAPTNEATE